MDDKYFGWRSVHPFVTRNFMLYNCSQTPLFLSSSVAMGGGWVVILSNETCIPMSRLSD